MYCFRQSLSGLLFELELQLLVDGMALSILGSLYLPVHLSVITIFHSSSINQSYFYARMDRIENDDYICQGN